MRSTRVSVAMDVYSASCSLASWLLRLCLGLSRRSGSSAVRCCCVVCKLALAHLGSHEPHLMRHSSVGQSSPTSSATPHPALFPYVTSPATSFLSVTAIYPPIPHCCLPNCFSKQAPLLRNQPSLISYTLSLASIVTMVQSDYDLLLEMGFDAERSTLAVKRTKGRKSRGFCYKPFTPC